MGKRSRDGLRNISRCMDVARTGSRADASESLLVPARSTGGSEGDAFPGGEARDRLRLTPVAAVGCSFRAKKELAPGSKFSRQWLHPVGKIEEDADRLACFRIPAYQFEDRPGLGIGE